jgi:Pyruvate/2-oxoacid:ferredoxin oxidoreductase delta subunit
MKPPDTSQRQPVVPGASTIPGAATAPLEIVARTVGAPEFVLPFLDRFYEPAETALVAALAGGPLGLAALRRRVAPGASRAQVRELLVRAYRRGVVERAARGRYRVASFHDRFVVWTFFEGWLDLPDDVRERLREWELSYYVERTRSFVDAARAGLPVEPIENMTYLLLDEVEEILRAQEHIYLYPCDCRTIMGRCRKPTLNCLRFEGPHGHWHDLGWEISVERAVENAREHSRLGLMHTGGLPGSAMRGICTCCLDCCFPQLAGERLGAVKLWPLSRYLARIDASSCDGCNRCVARCPFGAVARAAVSADGEITPPVVDPVICRGCGVCATGCRAAAIVMDPL